MPLASIFGYRCLCMMHLVPQYPCSHRSCSVHLDPSCQFTACPKFRKTAQPTEWESLFGSQEHLPTDARFCHSLRQKAHRPPAADDSSSQRRTGMPPVGSFFFDEAFGASRFFVSCLLGKARSAQTVPESTSDVLPIVAQPPGMIGQTSQKTPFRSQWACNSGHSRVRRRQDRTRGHQAQKQHGTPSLGSGLRCLWTGTLNQGRCQCQVCSD